MAYSEKSELKKAIWQYMVDHSQIQPNGFYGVLFYFKNKADFWRRVHGRMNGAFKRYNEQDKEAQSFYKCQKISHKFNKYIEKRERIMEIQEKGTKLDQALLTVYFNLEKYFLNKHYGNNKSR